MMQIPEELIPEQVPNWYSLWPPREVLARQFPDVIRMHYIRSKKPRIGSVQFLEEGFAAILDGTFRVKWLVKSDSLKAQCTCSYPKENCVHAWFLVIILEYCALTKSWATVPKPSLPENKKESATAQPHKKPDSHPPPPPVHADGEQLLLPFQEPFMQNFTTKKSLDIEADFRINPGYVTLRFYEVKAGKRAILRMQSLYNLTQSVVMKRASHWETADLDFLHWLHKKIKAEHVWKSNLQVLKLTKGKFDDWAQTWCSQPERFLDRETQKPVAFKVPASIHFELQPEGEKVRIKAFASTSFDNKEEFCKIFPSVKNKSKCVLNGVLVKLNVPILWKTLVECFSKKSPTMPKGALPSHLPILLENRLDLLRGKNIKTLVVERKLSLNARIDGAHLQFEVRDEKNRVVTQAVDHSPEIRIKGDHFEVTSIKSPAFSAMKKISHSLKPESDFTSRFRQSEKVIKKLFDLWPQIDVPKTCDKTLARVLSNSLKPELQLHIKENNSWLDYKLSWKIGDTFLKHDEVKQAVAAKRDFYRDVDGNWLHLDISDLKSRLEQLGTIEMNHSSGKKLSIQGKSILEHLKDQVTVPPSCRALAQKVRSMKEPPQVVLPARLQTKLRQYQFEGVQFINNRLFYDLGVILADDMGLGKTFQTLSLISSLQLNKPVLVVAPASVVYVWQDEIEKFMPEVKNVILTGAPQTRKKILNESESYDIIIANYHIIRNDLDLLGSLEFSMIVLDEAQMIKNPQAKITQAIKRLNSQKRLALSGTPVENRLTDLWSIFDFLIPGFLGSYGDFRDNYENSGAARRELAERVKPLILRRTKEKVAKELPPRTEEVIRCSMLPEQMELYRKVMSDAKNQVKERQFSIFAALTRLRQTCCDPALLGKNFETIAAAKLKCLLEMLEPIVNEGHSVLVFSQFTTMLERIETKLNKKEIKSFKLTGATTSSKRPALIKEFNDFEGASVFLLSLKAAGTGLTLTKADYVFIYDPWWNPAAEQQAIDRSHRIGQDKPVFVYKLVVKDSVEEKILALQETKKEMVRDIISDDSPPKHLTTRELAGLLDE